MTLYNREEDLRLRLNSFLCENFELPQHDYYGSLSTEAILSLKSVLSNINNILTLRVTLAFVEWVTDRLNLDRSARDELERSVLEAKPNSNGFDVWLGYPVAFVGEVKCNIPVKGGMVYGAQQRNGIEKNVTALLQGKKKASMLTAGCPKFLVFLDLPQVRKANDHLSRTSSICKGKLVEPEDSDELNRTDIVYVVYVSPFQKSEQCVAIASQLAPSDPKKHVPVSPRA